MDIENNPTVKLKFCIEGRCRYYTGNCVTITPNENCVINISFKCNDSDIELFKQISEPTKIYQEQISESHFSLIIGGETICKKYQTFNGILTIQGNCSITQMSEEFILN